MDKPSRNFVLWGGFRLAPSRLSDDPYLRADLQPGLAAAAAQAYAAEAVARLERELASCGAGLGV